MRAARLSGVRPATAPAALLHGLLLGLLLAVLAVVGPIRPAPVSAAPTHATFLSSDPADGSVLTSEPSSVSVTFDETLVPEFSQLALTRDGIGVPLGVSHAEGAVIRAEVEGPLPDGAYRIAYRAATSDGHVITGQTGFTLATGRSIPAGALPTTAPPSWRPTGSADLGPLDQPATQNWALPLATGLGSFAALGILLALIGRSKRRPEDPGS